MGIGLVGASIIQKVKEACRDFDSLDRDEQILVMNEVKSFLHSMSPMKDEPVDCVLWVPADDVEANDYNPNVVAPPEMRLLEHSILMDGYTQPIVTWTDSENEHYEVIDGFHRNRIGKEAKTVKERIHGYLPITVINTDREGRNDRIAATIRHNRARGKHQIQGMSDIVLELSRRNWSEQRIAKELGMDPDEVLRLKQITGLAEMFSDREFSEAWEYEEDDLKVGE